MQQQSATSWRTPLILTLLEMAADARSMLQDSTLALTSNDRAEAGRVLVADDVVDAARTGIQMRIVDMLHQQRMQLADIHATFALAQVASHLERVADYAVDISAIVFHVHDLPRDPLLLEDFNRMEQLVEAMWDLTLGMLERLDLADADALISLQQQNRTINELCVKKLLDIGADSQLREWGLRMMLVSRCYERVGDHLVDVAEQVAYLISGMPQQFLDASDQALDQWRG